MKLYCEIISREGRYSYRNLTSDELKDVKAKMKEVTVLEKEIEKLQKQLEKKVISYMNNPFYSSVFRDDAGFPYDVRLYVLTGKTNLI